jgi:hypothetical protein
VQASRSVNQTVSAWRDKRKARSPTRTAIKLLGSLGDMGGRLGTEGGVMERACGWGKVGPTIRNTATTRIFGCRTATRASAQAQICCSELQWWQRGQAPKSTAITVLSWDLIQNKLRHGRAHTRDPTEIPSRSRLIHTTPDSSHTPGLTTADSNVPHIPGAVENAGGSVRPGFGKSYAANLAGRARASRWRRCDAIPTWTF